MRNFIPIPTIPCRACRWHLDCPPCESDLDGLPLEGESCVSEDKEGAILVDPETDSVFLRRVMYEFNVVANPDPLHPVYNGYVMVWDPTGKLRLIARDPQNEPSLPFNNLLSEVLLWGRDDPDNLVPKCADINDILQIEEQPTGPVLMRWMAIQGTYGLSRPENGEINQDENMDYVTTERKYGIYFCPDENALTFLEEHDLTPILSEVAAEFDSDGRLKKAYWGGLNRTDYTCNKTPTDKTMRNYCKWDRDLAHKTDSGCILPIMVQVAATPPLQQLFDLYLVHYNSAGVAIHICKYVTLPVCSVVIDHPPNTVDCTCDPEACLKQWYAFDPFHIPHSPPCPSGIIIGCPDAQFFQINHGGALDCRGANAADGLACTYEIVNEFDTGGETPPPECEGLFMAQSGTPALGAVKFCKYIATQGSCT